MQRGRARGRGPGGYSLFGGIGVGNTARIGWNWKKEQGAYYAEVYCQRLGVSALRMFQ